LNIVDPVLAQCRYQPDALALCVPGGHHTVISYGQLGKMIHNAGRYARHVGLSPGQVAVIFTDDQILHASLILRLAKIGVVTVSGRNPELPIELKIDAIIADYGRIFSRQIRVIPANFSWTAGDGTPVEEGRAGSGDEVCRLIFTSGTTGDARQSRIRIAWLQSGSCASTILPGIYSLLSCGPMWTSVLRLRSDTCS